MVKVAATGHTLDYNFGASPENLLRPVPRSLRLSRRSCYGVVAIVSTMPVDREIFIMEQHPSSRL